MTRARASYARPSIALMLVLLGLSAFLAAGCGEDDGDVTYPDPLKPVVGQWFLGVWGSGPDDVYVVGQPGLIFHWNGSAWAQQTSGTTAALTDVWGDDSGNVYITGHDGVILRKSGDSWVDMGSGTDADLFAIGEYQGSVFACGRTAEFAVLRRLNGSGWSEAAGEIYTRDNEQAIMDTLYLHSDDDPAEIIESLTGVGYYGIAGADGVVLMEDPETDWQLRRILGGQEWIKALASSESISNNFIGTAGGRLFHLFEGDGERLAWVEVASPARDITLYGLFSYEADTAWCVTADGQVNRVDPPLDPDNNQFGTVVPMYEDGQTLFDIWGTSGSNLYAVGINGRVLHYHDVDGTLQWVAEELPLPETKAAAMPVFDRFGDPVH